MIIDPANGSNTPTTQVTIAYQIRGKPDEPIKIVRALVDGREVATAVNLRLSANGTFEGEVQVPVVGLTPALTLIAEGRYATSAPATVKLSGGSAPSDAGKPMLYVIAVGVGSNELHKELTLKYAANDAIEFAKRMRRQKGKLYRDVLAQPLADGVVRRKDIYNGLDWLESQVLASNDLVVLFVSSHGELDRRNDLYLIAGDTDPMTQADLRSTGVDWTQVRRTIEGISRRAQTIVFLDACRSGQGASGTSGSRPDMDGIANELLATNTDIVIITSSTGTQFSREDDTLKHGVFTYALLEALDGKAKQGSANMTIGDLSNYVRTRVSELTKDSPDPQTPMTTPLREGIEKRPLFSTR
jgi:hypothetical protein